MAIIMVLEFLATLQLIPLVNEREYALMIDTTLYSYGAMMLFKLGFLLWLFAWQMSSQSQASLGCRIG